MRVKADEKQEFKVMVTGFKPNPSGDITELMPTVLKADHPLNVADIDIIILDDDRRILTEFSWASIRQEIKDLHEHCSAEVDLWIHLGRSQWNHVTCERHAYRQDFNSTWLAEFGSKGYYRFVDNYGKIADDIGPCPWMNVPMGLHTAVDVNSVVADAQRILEQYAEQHPKKVCLGVQSHAEPGSHGCGFTFYESMANCYMRNATRNVLFCHVPPQEDQAALEQARDAVLAVIGASYLAIRNSQNRDPKLQEEWRERFEKDP